jgi:hypothetical protein
MTEAQALFEQLLKAETETEADAILRRAGYGLDNEAAWRPLGDMENNFSTVGNQQTEATAALVEKIINGLDADLMAECFRAGIDPQGPGAPRTMAEAVQRFYDVRDGLLGNVDAKRLTELAANLQVIAVGEKASPCYLIVDGGEGQTPDAFPDTFMSLNRSNKLRIPFVQGKFNSGGTGVLQFCGDLNMQLIASKRHPSAPIPTGDTSRDQWGFTIVRRMKPSAGRRNSMYVYLAPDGAVPRFDAETVAVLPDDRRSQQPRPYVEPIAYGTCVKLYNFRWKAKSIATTEARYELERYLHSPCLPFRLTETRDYRANYFATTIAGVWATISSADGPDDSKVEPNFPAYSDLNLTGVGPLPYRIAVFRDTVNSRHVPHGVFFNVNGQVHGALPSDFVARQLKFDYLKDHLLVSIDCTGMEPTVREDFFMASRDRVRKNEVYEEVLDHLKEALRDHPGLRQLNAARRKKEIEETLNDESETKNLFSDLLKADPTLASLFGIGDRLQTKVGPGEDQPFAGRRFPTFFRLAKNPQGGLVKRCPVNLTCRVEFETDAVNDYFKRGDSPGTITLEPANLIEHSNLWNGRFTARLRTPWDAKPGDRVEVRVTVSDIEREARSAPFVSKFTILAEPQQDRKPKPGPRPTPSNGNSRKPGSQNGEGLGIPQLNWKEFADQAVSLQVRHDDNGQPEYFANLKNQFLTAELIKAKDEDRPLVKFWFGYGLLLCALGMLKNQKERLEANGQGDDDETDGGADAAAEDLKQVSAYCDGIARVIIPIIRTLYRGPTIAAG